METGTPEREREKGGIYDYPNLTLSSQPYYVTAESHRAIYRCLQSKGTDST